MAAPKYKLIYFDIKGKAEPLRLMFAYAGVPFEDHRIKELPFYVSPEPKPEWEALQPKTPFGVCPVLEVDGKYLGETYAIARYLAKPLKLEGKDDWDTAQADAIATYIFSEFEVPFVVLMREMDKEKKEEIRTKMCGDLAKVAETLEKILQKNNANGGKGFYVGNTPTIADFFGMAVCDFAEGLLKPGVMAPYKHLLAHRDFIRSLPGVKEFIQKYAHLPF